MQSVAQPDIDSIFVQARKVGARRESREYLLDMGQLERSGQLQLLIDPGFIARLDDPLRLRVGCPKSRLVEEAIGLRLADAGHRWRWWRRAGITAAASTCEYRRRGTRQRQCAQVRAHGASLTDFR